MFDIGASELLLIVVIAIVVIGPKDLPMALRTAGRWIGKIRRVSGHFRAGVETMIREAELEEMEKKWREQNEAIMKANPMGASAEAALVGQDPGTTPAASAEAALAAPPEPEEPAAAPAQAKPKRTRKKAS
ncbi:MAG: twin-arginine translocase subunit TatB [Sphingomonadaceae bacterium]|nr:twin-arginine translocase subunit TatB [Sphingomonadaceae bacterium]